MQSGQRSCSICSSLAMLLALVTLAACDAKSGATTRITTATALPYASPTPPLPRPSPTQTPSQSFTLTPQDPGWPGFAFRVSGYPIYAWPTSVDPYRADRINEAVPRDAHGVFIYTVHGVRYDQPVLQGLDALVALSAYSASKDVKALTIALANAERLIAIHTVSGGAWWYPYWFDNALHGLSSEMRYAPWYSGMAQGRVLDLFTRLYAVTKDTKWRAAAEATFPSLSHPYHKGMTTPWAVNVDAAGYLWIQEYPGPYPDNTINGMNSAIWGLLSYYLTFGNLRAKALADGAMTTMLHYIGRAEHPGWISSYCLAHPQLRPAKYHGLVTRQLALLYSVTLDVRFAARAAQFAADFPIPHVAGRMTLAAGPQRLTASDDGASVYTVRFSSPTRFTVSQRVRLLKAQGYWYQLVDGPYAGQYVHESATAYLPGEYNTLLFVPAVLGVFPATTYRVYTLAGAPRRDQPTIQLTQPTAMSLSKHTTINGITLWQITDGPIAGYLLSGPEPRIG